MIKFTNNNPSTPYVKFRKLYDDALNNNQKSIEAAAISSYSKEKNEVDSRFVNIKFLDNERFIFFSNYNSSKAIQFSNHNQISVLFLWSSISTQIRMKATIGRMSHEYNQNYFITRSSEKNALAISSSQSKIIDSYDDVKRNYNNVINKSNLKTCPEYWGGYHLTPYYFEFWKGNKNRVNLREQYSQCDKNNWIKEILEP